MSDNLSWHWCFLINVPVGLISLVLIYMLIPSSPEKKKERERLWAKGLNFDVVGFLLIATFLGSLEVVLDRGQIDDWFGSGFIVTFAAISATALLLFIPWELNRPQPLIDIKMLTERQFGTGINVVTVHWLIRVPLRCRIRLLKLQYLFRQRRR